MNDGVRFSDAVIDRLHLLWGAGFLSPGGPEEVREMVAGVELEAKRILDIGCGTAGPAIVLAADLGAAQVVGIDVELRLLDRAARLVEEASLADRIAFQHVRPGRLPFPDASFDVVFSKDSILYIADKAGLFREVARILRPGGTFAASDWLADERAHDMPQFLHFLKLRELEVPMATVVHVKELMRRAGLTNVSARDRHGRFCELLRRDGERIEGSLKSQLIAAMGAARFARWADLRRACAEAACCGGLRQTHLRGHSAKQLRRVRMDNVF